LSGMGSRILVVEDDVGIREAVAECLASDGHVVSAVTNGAEALAWLQREAPPDLALVDLVMPVMDGAELLDRLQGDPALRSIPVVLMTAAMQMARAPRHGVAALLTKPFELDALLAVVQLHRRAA
jgi:two-component system chemotaxis response regulator CheY